MPILGSNRCYKSNQCDKQHMKSGVNSMKYIIRCCTD
jgi:hypothetical protein